MILLSLLFVHAARAGELRGDISAYGMTASSTSTEPDTGDQETLRASELGFTIRGRLIELDNRLGVYLDYRDRVAISQDVRTLPLRRLYRAEVDFAILPDRWKVGIGRFQPRSLLFLPVDGLRTAYNPTPDLTLSAFGGRRAITSSFVNVPFDQFLPAAGAAVEFFRPRLQITTLGTVAADEAVVLLSQTETFTVPSFLVSASGVPTESLTLGGQVAFASQASYTLGPTWSEYNLQVDSAGLWNGSGYANWRINPRWKMDYFFHHQRVGLYTAGQVGSTQLDEPNFTDNRARVSARVGDIGWIKADYRFRIRPEGTEQRYGLLLYGNQLGVDGLYARGRLYFDAISFEDGEGFFDRTLWSASAGYRRGALDVSAGGSFIERSVTPSSARQADATTSPDLSPFSLQAQRIAFVQGYYSGKGWFAGIDLEQNIEDNELRGMIQAGILGRKEWR